MARNASPHRGLWLAVLLLAPLLALAASPVTADSPEDQLRRLGDPKHEGHAAALNWWSKLAKADQVTVLRQSLASDDVSLATLAAEALGAEYLEANEIRRQMRLLLVRPLSVFNPPSERRRWALGSGLDAPGSPDLVPFFEKVVSDETGTYEDAALDPIHRVLRTQHVKDIVPLLAGGGPKVFWHVLWHVAMCGEYDREDKHRAEIARGLLYGLKRLRAQRKEEPPPPLKDVKVDVNSPPDGGLPETYRTLASAFPWDGKRSLRLVEDGPPSNLELPAVYHWLRRWALDLTPAASDLPYLKDLVEAGTAPEKRTCPTVLLRWALRHMAALPGEEGLKHVEAWAQGEDARAAYAAATLAERGAPRRFHALFNEFAADGAVGEDSVGGLLEDLLWAVDRGRACERLVNRVLKYEEVPTGEKIVVDVAGRHAKAAWDGIEITTKDMVWIADSLWKRGASPMTLGWFYGRVCPEGLTSKRAADLLKRLATLDPYAWEVHNPADVLPLLAMLEVRDKAGLVALLNGWHTTQEPLESEVLLWLARLGDATKAQAMIEDWENWNAFDQWVLGRVKHEAVDAFLKAQAKSDEMAYAVPAMQALVIRAGLPDPLVKCFAHFLVDEPDPLDMRAVRTMMLAGDVLGALLHLEGGEEPHFLGLVDDDRARDFLRRLQTERHHGRFREGTAGLAIAGDGVALGELKAFLQDDRTWMNERLPEGLGALLNQPWVVEHWVERLDSNCCLGHVSMVRLRQIYPTIPFEDGYGGAGTHRTRAWIASHNWKHSRLLDGLVPAGR